MKHQIILVGGQLLPIYVGIKENAPDVLHFIVSLESKSRLLNMRPFISSKKAIEYVCNPYNYKSVQDACAKALSKIEPTEEVSFNLTGGTKIMVLAAQSVMQERNVRGFYINQTDAILALPEFNSIELKSELTIDEFFGLSEHSITSKKQIRDFSSNDYTVANDIYNFALSDSRFKKINFQISQTYKTEKNPIPLSGSLKIKDTRIELLWNSTKVEIKDNGKPIGIFNSPNVHSLFFQSGWWELIIAEEVSKNKQIKELYVQSILPFRSDKAVAKNEIDILVNLGRRMVFIECKSGKIKQEDINKIKVVRDTYGGVISRSVLASFEKPSPVIAEKCQELGIGIYFHSLGRLGKVALKEIHKCIETVAKEGAL